MWDQTLLPNERTGAPPRGFERGVVFNSEKINEALQQETEEERFKIVPSRDVTGHGTAVTGVAAGNGRASDLRYIGAAPNSSLLIVKLGVPTQEGFPKTTELMRALTYVTRVSVERKQPVAINISFGNTYGSHLGNSLLERFLDNISEQGTNVICVGSGNEGASRGHYAGKLTRETTIEGAVGNYETGLSIQLWKNSVDVFRVFLETPEGIRLEIPMRGEGTNRLETAQMELLIYIGEATPYSVNQEIFIDFLPKEEYVTPGIWKLTLVPVQIVTGEYSLYLPSQSITNTTTGFFLSSPEMTLTIPSTSQKVVTVGAYNSIYDSYADFSGRGYVYRQTEDSLGQLGNAKPDLVAPGVNITTTEVGGGYVEVTGTSFATPFVTGASALLMEWGIVRRNDPFLYGEKVKANLRKGARQLPGYDTFPNSQVGYGALCVRDSLPG